MKALHFYFMFILVQVNSTLQIYSDPKEREREQKIPGKI